jgi:hypothetical protein
VLALAAGSSPIVEAEAMSSAKMTGAHGFLDALPLIST